jgi:hypothetical protein
VALFSDDFERANTLDGTIGPDWTLKAPYVASYPLPASSYGRIESGKFVADASRIVYAQRTESVTVRRIKARISFVVNPAFDGGQAVTGAATAALIISQNANLVELMGLHVIAARAANIVFQKRIAGGSFVTLGTITGHGMVRDVEYELEAWVTPGGNWGVSIDRTDGVAFTKKSVTGTDAALDALLSGMWGHELFQNGVNHVDLVRIHSVKAFAN